MTLLNRGKASCPVGRGDELVMSTGTWGQWDSADRDGRMEGSIKKFHLSSCSWLAHQKRIYSNYSDFTYCPSKTWFSHVGNPPFFGKSRLVRYYKVTYPEVSQAVHLTVNLEWNSIDDPAEASGGRSGMGFATAQLYTAYIYGRNCWIALFYDFCWRRCRMHPHALSSLK